MKQFIEKLIGRLEEELKLADEVKEKCARENPLMFDNAKGYSTGIANAKSFVNQLAEEYNNGWIPCEKDTPKENGWYWGYYVTSSYIDINGVKHEEYKYASIYWEDNLWLYDPRGFRTIDSVVAWKPIAPYQPKGE